MSVKRPRVVNLGNLADISLPWTSPQLSMVPHPNVKDFKGILEMFNWFKRVKTHQLPFQFFFGKDSRFHPEAGKLMVKSGEVIRFSIVGMNPETPLDPLLIDALFEEAELVKLSPIGIVSFNNVLNGYKYEFNEPIVKQSLVAKRLTPSVGDVSTVGYVHLLVRSHEDDYSTLHFHPVLVEEFIDVDTTPNVTPTAMRVIFDHVEMQGLIPIAWLGNGYRIETQYKQESFVFSTEEKGIQSLIHHPGIFRFSRPYEARINTDVTPEPTQVEDTASDAAVDTDPEVNLDLPAVMRNPRKKVERAEAQ